MIQGFHRSSANVGAAIEQGGDAAYPPPGGDYPAGTKVGAFYIGGDTPHAWTVAEINVMAAGVEYLLPIYVRSNPGNASGAVDGAGAVAALNAIGAPADCLIALDLETATDASYVADFDAHVAGHPVVKYGSADSLFGNPGPFYWVAEPGAAQPDARAQGTQYAWDQTYDLTWWDDAFIVARAWATASAPKPVPPPPVYALKQVVADGTQSLADIAKAHNNGIGAVIWRTFRHTSWQGSLVAYVVSGRYSNPLPKGTIIVVLEKVG